MAKRIALSFVKNLYVFFILLLSDPFDVLERWGGVNYEPPSWLFWVLLAVAIGLASWRTIEDTKKSIRNEEKLDSIKNDLLAMDQCEKDAAIVQGRQTFSSSQIVRIQNDFDTLYTVSRLESVIQEVRGGNVEPLFDFFRAVGDILDANDYGLKIQLQNTPKYDDTLVNLTGKVVTLRLGGKKRDLVQNNVARLRKSGYGLNSGMILRSMLKRAHPRSKSEQATAQSIVVGLEALENIGRDFLTYGLSHLDSRWKLRYNPGQPVPSQTQVILGRVSTLNKKRFGTLHDFKDMIKRNLP